MMYRKKSTFLRVAIGKLHHSVAIGKLELATDETAAFVGPTLATFDAVLAFRRLLATVGLVLSLAGLMSGCADKKCGAILQWTPDQANSAHEACDEDNDGHTACRSRLFFPDRTSFSTCDCDDHDYEVNPDRTEHCDDTDDSDCSGDPDDGYILAFRDDDGDGYGLSSPSLDQVEFACSELARSDVGGDCDDQSSGTHPYANEVCDYFDNDCDGEVDEDVLKDSFYADRDGDGFGDQLSVKMDCSAPDGYVTNSSDCDDTDPTIYPNADEVCNGNDDDCDDDADEGLPTTTYYQDSDEDGVGDSDIYDESCSDSVEGYSTASGDCNDENSAVYPDAAELCNGIDDDCDGDLDEGQSTSAVYLDSDHDGYGSPEDPITACAPPGGYVTNADDCDDSNAEISPSQTELCDDGWDNDCSGTIDDGLILAYPDDDQDGYGRSDSELTEFACSTPARANTAADCDDQNAAINPSMPEICNNGIDDNCIYDTCNLVGDYSLEDPKSSAIRFYGIDDDRVGYFVTSASDIDLDGASDFVVTAVKSEWDINADSVLDDDVGSVFIIYGPITETQREWFNGGEIHLFLDDVDQDGVFDDSTIRYTRYNGANASDYAGVSVCVGRFDTSSSDQKDGYPDIVIGAAHPSVLDTSDSEDGSGGAQSIYVDIGPIQPGIYSTNDLEYQFYSSNDDENVGYSLACDQDITGDDADDIFVGDPNFDANGNTDSGAAYIVSGDFAKDFPATDEWPHRVDFNDTFRIYSDEAGASFGFSVALCGDVNGGGAPDFLVGAPTADYSRLRIDNGFAYLFLGESLEYASGSQSFQAVIDHSGGTLITIAETGYALGWHVDCTVDLNNDDLADLVLGAPQARPDYGEDAGEQDYVGGLYIVLGQKNLPSEIDLKEPANGTGVQVVGFLGEADFDLFGKSAQVIDFNQDTYPDLLIGAPYSDDTTDVQEGFGTVYLLYGPLTYQVADGSTVERATVPDSNAHSGFARFLGRQSADQLGWYVASAGDINADGFPDLLMGGNKARVAGNDGAGIAIVVAAPSK